MHSFFLTPLTLKAALLNSPFSFFIRFCDLITVNSSAVKLLFPEKIRKRVLVVYDPPLSFPKTNSMPRNTNILRLVMPASFARDEPLEELILAVKKVSKEGIKVKLYITGNYNRRRDLLKYHDGDTIVFTGFLSRDDFFTLLSSCDIIVALTSFDFSAAAAATEGLFLEKPLLLSNKPALRSIFRYGAIFVENNVDSIANAIKKIATDKDLLDSLQKLIKKGKNNYVQNFNRSIMILQKILIRQ